MLWTKSRWSIGDKEDSVLLGNLTPGGTSSADLVFLDQ